ncbi:MAG: cytochrome c oxidase assembly protein subunit 15 [Phycisphaerales bacterium]|nr:cytochrome c oxidase assembly protein subunit 15 [Phycisphaerales bacterium]MDB5358030.1 cytochrome c oxidase assembly protein subunit 15 [Phycisphaerales bacterium]
MFIRSNTLAAPLDCARSAPVRAVATSRGMHILALLTATATFPLIFMGGLVTSHHAGMSVPDWPNSYGYNMFLFPPSRWVGGILYEHTHRLMATVVGMLSIAMVVWAWRAQIFGLLASIPRLVQRTTGSANESAHGITARTNLPDWLTTTERHRWLAVAVLGAVIFQGVLGGLRVVLVQLDLAIVHACVAQAFFCLAAFTVVVTSRWWQDAPDLSAKPGGRSLIVLGSATVAIVFLQLIAGATMRHFDAGLAIPDLPLAYGKLLPPVSAEGLATINHVRAFELNLDPVTLTQLWLHFAHRIGAVLVTVFAVLLATKVLRKHVQPGLIIPATLLVVLLQTQITLGILTVLLRKPADVASSHVAVGALVLVTSFVLTVRAVRLYSRPNRMAGQDASPSPSYSGERAGVRGRA